MLIVNALTNLPTVYFCDSDTSPVSENVLLSTASRVHYLIRTASLVRVLCQLTSRGKQQQTLDFASVTFPIRCLIGFGAVDSGNMTALALNTLLSDKNLEILFNRYAFLVLISSMMTLLTFCSDLSQNQK